MSLKSCNKAQLLGGDEGRRAINQIEATQYDVDDLNRRLTSTIYSHGKLVGHGSGIEQHVHANIVTLDAYSNVLKSWEANAAFGWIEDNGHFTPHGAPFVFNYPLSLKVDDLENLVEFIFTSGPPFRLLGIPLSDYPGHIDVDAIDLHTGDRLRFEFSQVSLRLFLPIGTCANAVMRFWSNFERYLAAEVQVSLAGDTSPILGVLKNAD